MCNTKGSGRFGGGIQGTVAAGGLVVTLVGFVGRGCTLGCVRVMSEIDSKIMFIISSLKISFCLVLKFKSKLKRKCKPITFFQYPNKFTKKCIVGSPQNKENNK